MISPTPTVIAEMHGIPTTDRLKFGQWSRDLTDFLGATKTTLADVAAQADRSLRHLTEYFQGLIARRRQDLGQDLISSLIQIEQQDDLLSEE